MDTRDDAPARDGERARASTARAGALRALAAACVGLALGVSARAGVLTVGPQPGDWPNIAAAVAAAAEGDVVLVRSGTYGPFTIDHKSLAVVADAGADVVVFGAVRVRHLAAGQQARLAGLAIAALGSDALGIDDVQGSVRVEECAVHAYASSASNPVNGATITNADDVVLSRTLVDAASASAPLAAAGDALRLSGARVALLDVLATGAAGAHGDGNTPAAGAAGGAAVRVLTGELYVSGGRLRGGAGGRGGVAPTGLTGCAASTPLVGGAGGPALVANGTVRVRALDARGGSGGIGGVTTCGDTGASGLDGAAALGTLTSLAGPARTLAAPRVARAGNAMTFTFTGAPGERVVLFVTSAPAHAWAPAFDAPVFVAPPIERRLGGGILPVSGAASLTVTVPPPPAGLASVTRHVQATVVDATGQVRAGDVAVLTILAPGW